MSIPNFSDLVAIKTLEGEKKRIDDILGKPIIVTGWRKGKSKFDKTDLYITIQFYFENDETETKYVVFTGSEVLSNQLEEIGAKLDADGAERIFRAMVAKVGKHYSFA